MKLDVVENVSSRAVYWIISKSFNIYTYISLKYWRVSSSILTFRSLGLPNTKSLHFFYYKIFTNFWCSILTFVNFKKYNSYYFLYWELYTQFCMIYFYWKNNNNTCIPISNFYLENFGSLRIFFIFFYLKVNLKTYKIYKILQTI